MPVKKGSINLYWVTTQDHDEDWFIFARTPRSAAAFHERYEGYNTHDAKAHLVVAQAILPNYEHGPPPCHAQIPDLIALGFEVAGGKPQQRGVRFNGKLYIEGNLQSLVVQCQDKIRETSPRKIATSDKRSKKTN